MIELNFPSKSPLLPEFNINLFNCYIDEDIRKQLKDVVLAEEANILSIPTPDNPNSGDWLTSRLWYYNFLEFKYDCVKDFHNFIYNSYKQYMSNIGVDSNNSVYIHCWVNIIRRGGRTISAHHHDDVHGNRKIPYFYSYVSGNICIDVQETSTFFAHPLLGSACGSAYKEIPNKNAEMILFPSFMTHWVSENKNEQPRITISFDIITEEVYNMLNNINYRLLTLR